MFLGKTYSLFRNDAISNKDSAIARNIIDDHFKCNYLGGGYGEKVLSFLKESGKLCTYIIHT